MNKDTSTQSAGVRFDSVSNQAKELWEKAGCPEGRDLEFWLAAEKKWNARENNSGGEATAASPPPQTRAERPKSTGKEKRSPRQENL